MVMVRVGVDVVVVVEVVHSFGLFFIPFLFLFLPRFQ